MATENYKNLKYVVLVCIMGVLLILGSVIVSRNYVDIAYLAFIAFCFMRYLVICHNE